MCFFCFVGTCPEGRYRSRVVDLDVSGWGEVSLDVWSLRVVYLDILWILPVSILFLKETTPIQGDSSRADSSFGEKLKVACHFIIYCLSQTI